MTPEKQRGNFPTVSSYDSRTANAARPDTATGSQSGSGGGDAGASPSPQAGPSRAWMTPVLPDGSVEPSVASVPPPPEFSAQPDTIAPVPPPMSTDRGGVFAVGADFRLQSLQRANDCTLFAADVPPGTSIWSALYNPVRHVLYSAFKRLLGGEEQVVCQAGITGKTNSTQYEFECARHGDQFVTRYRCLSQSAPIPYTGGNLPGFAPPLSVSAPATALDSTAPEAALPRETRDTAKDADVQTDLFRLSPDIICVLDGDGRLLHVNPSGKRALRFSPHKLPGLPFSDLVAPEDHEMLERAWQQIISASGPVLSLLCRCNGINGDLRWVQWHFAAVRTASPANTIPAEVALQRVYAIGRDVTENRTREESLHWHLYHDALTGLPNRSLLQDRLQYAIALANRYKHKAAVLFLDLDRFKRVNDTLGHAAGDALLREVAGRLNMGMREEDTVARLAGDEFVIVLPRVQDFRDAQHVAEKIQARVGQSLTMGGQELFVTASIGISMYPQDGATVDALLRSADTAMYRAKAGGPGRFSLHDTTAAPAPGRGQDASIERLRLENNLSQAIERDELFLHYQPQISIASGQVVGAEALMRWKSGDGLVPPSTFIPLAEESGLIVRLGTWAMHEAIVQAGQWRREGHPVQVSVNLSAVQLSDKAFPDMLDSYLRQWQIPASLLDLEMTERTFVDAESSMLDVLKRLKTMGVGLSVDDFGTGYGTFSYLRKFPIDGLKVDHSFIAQVDTNPADEAVVRSIIDLAHTLNLKVIAEGVETVGQRDKLMALGCDTMQGYLFSAALPPDDLSPMLMFTGKA